MGLGGFRVSGTLAMLPGIEPNVQRALDMGAFVHAGEAEKGRLEMFQTEEAEAFVAREKYLGEVRAGAA